MAFVLWLMFWIAGQQAPVLQTPGSSSESSFLCTEPATTARGANGQYVNPVCASIDGVVVRAGSTTGIPNAQVILEFPNSGSQADVIKIVADSAGRFSFPSINPVMFPDGYNVTADADGYEHAIFGQIGNNESGELINFKGVQKHRNLTLPLIPYPSASGSVQTSGFQPVAAALVRAYRIQYTPIGRRLKIARSVLTNDLGDFRFAWIDPADYYVSASYSERARELAVAGTILTPNLSNPDSGYVTAFYPSAISSSDATAFTIRAGEKSNLNITLKESDRFKVHVHVFAGSTLQPQHFNIALMPAGADAGDAPDYAIQSNGSADFDIPNVGPGRYALVAFEKSRILSEAIPITVDHDLDVKLPIYNPLDLPGSIADEFGSPFPGKLSVRLVRTDPELGQTIEADVDSGSFLVPDVGPGDYDVYVDGLPKGFYIKDVRFPVNDDQFGRIHIEPGKPERTLDATTQKWKSDAVIQVVLARATAVVEGTVWTGAKSAEGPVVIAGALVVLVPDRMSDNGYAVREDRYVTGNTDAEGRFQLKVPPGNYTAFAFVEIQPGLYFDSQFYDRVSDLGARVIIRGAETLDMTFCEDHPASPTPCLLRVPRERSSGIAP